MNWAALSLLLNLCASDVSLNALQGPVPADRSRHAFDTTTHGLWFESGVEGGHQAGHYWLAPKVGAGFSNAWGQLYVELPFRFVPERLDIDTLSGERTLPSCPPETCPTGETPFLAQALMDAAPSLLKDFRIQTKNRVLLVQGGPLRLRFGQGTLVNGYLNQIEDGERPSGVFMKLSDPLGRIELQTAVGNVLQPGELIAGQLNMRPFGFLSRQKHPVAHTLFHQGSIALEVAMDDRRQTMYQALIPEWEDLSAPLKQPLVGINSSVQWPLLPQSQLFQITPYAGFGVMNGLRAPAASSWGVNRFGMGGFSGARLDLHMPWLGMSLSGQLAYDTDAHQTGFFGPLYKVQRRQHGRPQKEVDYFSAPIVRQGYQHRYETEIALTSHLRLGGQLQMGQNADDQRVGLHGLFSFAGLQFGARLVEESPPWLNDRISTRSPLSSVIPPVDSDEHQGRKTHHRFVMVQTSVAIWGPLSAYAQGTALWTPQAAGNGTSLSTAWTCGLSSNMVFSSR